MGRRKKGRKVSGWLILDKPDGIGSTQAVGKARWLFGAQKAGHAGTLDPLASGLLPIALGDATRTVPHVVEGRKTYRFTVGWGFESTTDDREGGWVAESDERPSAEAIEALLPRYTGTIEQVPPTFSAVKLDGQRAYDLARKGEEVVIEPREVEVHEFRTLGHREEGGRIEATTFEVDCGKGTYVRAFARDMGRDLGCRGYVQDLRRTAVAPFDEEDMVEWGELIAFEPGDNEDDSEARFEQLDALLLDTAEALEGQPCVELSSDQATRVSSGNSVILRGRNAPLPADAAHATYRGKLVALGRIEMGAFHPSRVFGG